ncbi:glycoside hydrolase [Sphingomonas ginkgonis]|uniref:Glycoside hydrolase n=1 Tax=Sphingomonas ginkgonis TaxID=2315330 RepID=A0A3S0EL98_9SPHN|nr:cellulase N-terminal Ig-like domain-containing protein [Sphingomonas ginkgonis]RST30209.1 glycoside hydrolase [Sphingomonas ginkgonis]
MRRAFLAVALLGATMLAGSAAADQLRLNDRGYFAEPGLNVMVFNDYYPEGHQTGVTIIQHGQRVAANGDLKLDPSPGQWSPLPKTVTRTVDPRTGTISQTLVYPNPDSNGHGFNPVFYPPLQLGYRVSVTPAGGSAVRVHVTLDRPLPAKWAGRAGFNLELFPALLFGKGWLMDGAAGIFPRDPIGPMVRTASTGLPVPRNVQANGPIVDPNGEPLAAPLATGTRFVVAPEDDRQRLTIESRSGPIELRDGRSNHNNGWFIVRAPLAAGQREIEWVVTPNVVPGWKATPVIQANQLGYAPAAPKQAVLELDPADRPQVMRLLRLDGTGPREVMTGAPQRWGDWLRSAYYRFDFSQVRQPGLYQLSYGDQRSAPFRIADDVLARGAWQPTLEYFLPVQMCHMLVREKYRVWHGLDHVDDALMARTSLNHFDGYEQGASTLTKYKPGQHVPGLDRGGWHDAGDYDLRIESQIGTVWLLARMVEEFGLDDDSTSIDETRREVEIHAPDGKNDALQQLEHGLLSVLGGYRAMGRVYRGIQDVSLRQYAMLGEAANATDNIVGKPVRGMGLDNNGKPITADDRWVFTEEDPKRELYVVGGLAAAARSLKASNPAMAAESLAAARHLFAGAFGKTDDVPMRVFALAELIHSTGDPALVGQLVALEPQIVAHVDSAWPIASILPQIGDTGFKTRLAAAVARYQAEQTAAARTDSPYGVPYKPNIWGAGWDIQERGVHQWFFHQGWPDATPTDSFVNALNFVLGTHPGQNNASFVSGVGAKSATVAYGFNRADWSYVPGGVTSGTALIRPDLPEYVDWPYFWQQREYVLGGGETNFMFLALATDQLYRKAGK